MESLHAELNCCLCLTLPDDSDRLKRVFYYILIVSQFPLDTLPSLPVYAANGHSTSRDPPLRSGLDVYMIPYIPLLIINGVSWDV